MNKLIVRRLEQDDLAVRVDWFNTPTIYQQMVVNAPLSLADTRKWFSETLLNTSRRDFSFLLPEATGTRLVAMGGLSSISWQHKHAELYIVVEPERVGKGIGQKAIKWLCNFGFVQLGLNRIYLFTVENNNGARRLYERLGFVHEGKWKEHIFHHGRYIDRHIQAILKNQWEHQAWAEQHLVLEIPLE